MGGAGGEVRNLVYSVPVKYRMPPQDAADVFQAVWAQLFAELPRLRSVDGLRSWLITVAGHKCYQWKREQSSQAAAAEPAYEPIDRQALYPEWRQQVEREQMLRDALFQLPPRCQEMMRLLFYHQPPLPYKEVAERLGLAEGSIGFIRGRCLKSCVVFCKTLDSNMAAPRFRIRGGIGCRGVDRRIGDLEDETARRQLVRMPLLYWIWPPHYTPKSFAWPMWMWSAPHALHRRLNGWLISQRRQIQSV